ncbi:ergosterol biosynthesis protein-like protein Erg28 [Podospora aff. communis PSN243]|uniref:Ergosterol biosynthesis protein-like protein Erg28 n=1 Tax=Podospora aff. communis PSN243 TaxID=3040156 RepID=A0AAV9GQB9_9PEZI|nr:ergosterol biosynthesis protein-like protein Erg28 [Podospora aff. communis PSN243]
MEILPSTEKGYLPYFLLYQATAAFIHAIVCYLSPPAVSTVQFRGSGAPPPTTLLAHVYGVKNFYTVLIRLYAAYHIGNREVYTLAMLTFVGVLWLYVTELAVWKTVTLRDAAVPYVTAGLGLIWMVRERGWYTG